MSIWRYGAKMSATHIFLAPERKKQAPDIRLGLGRPASSVGKVRPPYFTAPVFTHVYYNKNIFNFICKGAVKIIFVKNNDKMTFKGGAGGGQDA